MATCAFPKFWSEKPASAVQIRRGAFSNQLAFCVLFNEGGGTSVVDLASGQSVTAITTPPVWGVSRAGTIIQSGVITWPYRVADDLVTANFSAFAVVEDLVNSGTDTKVCGNYATAAGTGWEWGFDDASVAFNSFYLRVDGVSTSTVQHIRTSGVWVYGLTYDGSNVLHFRNGRLISTVAKTTLASANAARLPFFRAPATYPRFAAVGYWNRTLSHPEIAQVTESPAALYNALLQDQLQVKYFSTTSAPAGPSTGKGSFRIAQQATYGFAS